MSFWPFSLFDEDASWLTTAVVASAVGLFVFTVRKWKRRPPVVLPAKVSRKRQAIPIEEESGAFKSGLLVDTNKQVMESMWPEINTLYQLFLRGLEISENNRCLGYRPEKKAPYTFISYAETFRRSQNIGSAFVNVLDLQSGNETKIGIYARNSVEWFISCLACVRFSIVVVPLYDTLGPEAAKFIVQQTEMQAIVVDDLDKLEKLLANSDQMPTLKHIVLINYEGMENDVIDRANAANIQIHKFNELLQKGEENIATDVEPTPDDLYIICYTSGTTGNPKGVMLSHRNVIANVTGVMKIIESFIPAINNSHQLTISYLPLSHMFEQVVHWSVLLLGGSIGYFSGDVRTLMDDMQALKPTIFPTVPRLLNRFYDLLQKLMDKPNLFMRVLFRLAYYRKLAIVKSGIVQRDSFWDRLVFQKFQDQVGGAIQLVVTGSAPISGEVLDACRVAFGSHVLEGYGQTETCAMATLTWPYETESQHCGGPACCTKLKLEDVSELNYFSSERKGEILIKGPSVTRGYYKDPEKTKELFDEDGYLHTGDIGHILPNGTLRIIDRKKHIFKLAQGEYVAPEKIESVYVKSPYVQQVYVDGDSLENYLIAIVVPESHELRNWYKATTGNQKQLEEICKEKMVRDHVLADVLALGKQNKLNSIEQIKAIWLEPTPWSVENGMLTPTFKSKRPKLREHYRTVISDLYKGK